MPFQRPLIAKFMISELKPVPGDARQMIPSYDALSEQKIKKGPVDYESLNLNIEAGGMTWDEAVSGKLKPEILLDSAPCRPG